MVNKFGIDCEHEMAIVSLEKHTKFANITGKRGKEIL